MGRLRVWGFLWRGVAGEGWLGDGRIERRACGLGVGRGCVLRGWGAVVGMRALRRWDLSPCGASADKPHLSA